MGGHVFIVGNADVDVDHGPEIDAADVVVRFNRCRNLGRNTGRRTTELWLTNTGRAGLEFVDQARTAKLLERVGPHRVLMPRPAPGPLRRRLMVLLSRTSELEHGAGIARAVRLAGLSCDYAASDLPRETMRALRAYGIATPRPKAPSTGILAVHHFATAPAYRDHRISLVGFRFEGWRWHPWRLERAYVDDLESQGRLVLRDRLPA